MVKGMVFPVVFYGCPSWTIKKAEHWRIDAFDLWCWRRLLRVPWTARRLNQSILKEIYPEYSLEGLMLKLKLQYFVHLMWRASSLEKTLMLGKVEGRGRRGWQDKLVGWHHWLNGQEFEQAPGDGEGQGSLACCSPWGHKESNTTERLNNNNNKYLCSWMFCQSLLLLIVMPSARNAWGTHIVCVLLLGTPTDISLTGASVWLFCPSWFLLWSEDTLSKHHEETLKHRMYYSQILEVTWHTQWPHTEVKGRQGEGTDLRFRLNWGLRVRWLVDV